MREEKEPANKSGVKKDAMTKMWPKGNPILVKFFLAPFHIWLAFCFLFFSLFLFFFILFLFFKSKANSLPPSFKFKSISLRGMFNSEFRRNSSKTARKLINRSKWLNRFQLLRNCSEIALKFPKIPWNCSDVTTKWRVKSIRFRSHFDQNGSVIAH